MQATLVTSSSSAFTSLTQADFTTLASWGITGLVLYTDGNGQNFSFDATAGGSKFSGSPGSTMPASGQPYYKQWVFRTLAGYAHNAGIKVYAPILAFNAHQSASNTGYYGPQLGSFNPSYTDPNGSSWTDWYQMMADLGDALVWMGFDGVYLDNEDARFSGGTGESTWCAGYWANSFGASTTVAQERAWAQAAGAAVMGAINGGRSGANGNNYPLISYNSNSGGRLGNFPGGIFTQYYNHFGTTVSFHYQSNTSAAPDTAMINYSSYLWFLKGLATATTATVLFGDPAFYNSTWMTATGLPWHGSSDAQSWTNAIATNVAAFAALANGTTIPGFTLPSNVFISPMIWPLDQTTVAGNGATWSQATWNSAKPAIWAGAQAGMYMIYQNAWVNYGTGLSMNYASNTYISPPSPATTGTATSGGGANYTPLGTTNVNPPAGNGTAVGVNPTVTTGSLIASAGAGAAVGVDPSVSIGPSPSTGTATAVGVKPVVTGNLVTTTTQITITT